MKKYEDLTERQKAYICNGCGGKGGIVVPPKAVFFKASCNRHDYGFWKGCTEDDFSKCNSVFYIRMKEDVKRLPMWKRPYYYTWCRLYFTGVSIAGKGFFNFAKKKREVDDFDWNYIFKNYDPDDKIPWDTCLKG